MVVIVVGVLIVVVAAAATVFACHLSLLCQLTNELVCVVILNPVFVGGIRSRYAFPLRRSRRSQHGRKVARATRCNGSA